MKSNSKNVEIRVLLMKILIFQSLITKDYGQKGVQVKRQRTNKFQKNIRHTNEV
jgi:hypothetical protein